MRRVFPGKALLWLLLCAPAVAITGRWFAEPELLPGDLLHSTGEWAARLMVFALVLTPLSTVLPRREWVRWLIRHRRAFGVFAFGYATLHLLFYVLDMETVANMLAEIGAMGVWSGWLAFLLLVPVALASNDHAVRRLGAAWKRVQRLAYPAAILTLVHWITVHDGLTAALLTFAPLALLQLYRVVALRRDGVPSSVPLRRQYR